MTQITKELNDAILLALRGTGHRFFSSWRQTILDIVGEFEGIGTMGASHVAEDLRGFHFREDLRGFHFMNVGADGGWGIHKPITRELQATVGLSDVNTPWSDEDIVIGERWGKVGPKVAWFLERIRELNFMGTEDHRDFLYGREMEHVFDSLYTQGCLEGITWSVLIKYLSFIREMSNWTMPLMPGSDMPHQDCLDHWQRLMNGEVSGMGEGHVYECFNQEQGERLPAEWNRVADLPRREHVIPQGGSENARQEGNKKEMIHEIMGIIEQQVGEDKITEQKYMELSGLLMDFHKSIK